MPFTFLINPALTLVGWARDVHQRRRKVRLTVHRAYEAYVFGAIGDGPVVEAGDDFWYLTVTNASHDRDVVVTHIWIDTEPPLQVYDSSLPVRLQYSAPWAARVPVADVTGDPERVPWLARCKLSPDGKVIKSRPNKDVPPFGTVPRG